MEKDSSYSKKSSNINDGKDFAVMKTNGGDVILTRKGYNEFKTLRKRCGVTIMTLSKMTEIPKEDIARFEKGGMYYRDRNVIQRLFDALKLRMEFSDN